LQDIRQLSVAILHMMQLEIVSIWQMSLIESSTRSHI
jgi:hypothetical protein